LSFSWFPPQELIPPKTKEEEEIIPTSQFKDDLTKI
jgi:hypothetical protein